MVAAHTRLRENIFYTLWVSCDGTVKNCAVAFGVDGKLHSRVKSEKWDGPARHIDWNTVEFEDCHTCGAVVRSEEGGYAKLVVAGQESRSNVVGGGIKKDGGGTPR